MLTKKASEWSVIFCDNAQKYLLGVDPATNMTLEDIHNSAMTVDSGEIIDAVLFYITTDGIPQELKDFSLSFVDTHSVGKHSDLVEMWGQIKQGNVHREWKKLNTIFDDASYIEYKNGIDAYFAGL